MPCTARVLIFQPDSEINSEEDTAEKSLVQRLEDRGFSGIFANTAEQAFSIACDDPPDIALLIPDHHPGQSDDADPCNSFAKSLKNNLQTANVPLVMLSAENSSCDTGASSIADEVITRPFHDAFLFNRLESLVRLNTMQGELARRAATALKYGVPKAQDIASVDDIADANLLIVGRMGEDFETVEQKLAQMATLTHSLSPSTAMDYLQRRKDFDALVIVQNDNAIDFLSLCTDIRRNTRLYNLPILVICDTGSVVSPELAYSTGVTDLIYRPLDGTELKGRISALIRQQRYRMAMQEVYRNARHLATSDSLTGLYSHGFLHEHLGVLIEESQRHDKNLSVAALRLANISDINETFDYSTGDHVLRQVSGMMGRLLRGEDLPARYNGNEFVVVMPDTTLEEATIAVQRLANVVNMTELAVADIPEPVSAHLRPGIANLQPDDNVGTLIDRARNLTR